VIKAFRLSAEGLQPVRQYLDRCQQLGCRPQAVLADAYRPGEYGGTGLALDWPAISSWREILGETSFVLAGGLKPENVGQAIGIVRPSGVDTASGVEKAPGVKDASLMQAYAAAARDALAAVSSCQSTRANLS
jgi:phosphoribosylanthranilate isomerase